VKTATPKRVLHVYQSPSFSGAEAYAKEVAEYHQRSGHHVSFLVLSKSPLATKIRGDAVIQYIVDSPEQVDWRSFDVIVLHSTQELKNLKWRLAKVRLFSQRAQQGAPARRRPRIVLYSHIWISHSKRDPLHAIVYSLIDQFWCSSQASKSVLEKHLPIAKEKIKVVRYGRDTNGLITSFLSREEARSRLEIPQRATVFGTIARVDAGKGSRELWNSALTTLRRHPDAHFLMIGPATASDPKAVALDSALDKELKDIRSSDPNLGSRITKIGRLDGGTAFLPAFDLFVLATYKENFALTLLEAQLAGVPCLGTNSGGTPDLIHDAITGWLFQSESESDLTEALERALLDRHRWPEISSQSRAQILKNYQFTDVMKVADKLLF
jgi:glycosyltransferase involved in cell wall biosynthesis